MKKFTYKVLPTAMIFALIVYFTYEAYASSSGKTGQNSAASGGCYCHSSSASSATTVTLTSGSLAVEPGSSNDYTIRVSNSNSSQTKAGINIAVKTSSTGETNAGTLSPASGSGLQSSNNELTHTSPKSFSGGNADFSFSWTAPTAPGTYYMRAAGNAVNNSTDENGDQWNFMTIQEITVKGVTLTEPSASNLSFCAGGTATIKWTQTGVTNVKIELSTNGGTNWGTTIENSISAASGSYTWNIPSNITTGNQFKIRVSDASSASLNSVSANNFSIGGPFTIATHPESKDICAGTNHTLSVSVTGAGVKYQWKKGTNDITGATDATYQITNASAANAGVYTVVVSSNCQASVTSNPATINILEGTVITTQPASQNICADQPAVFNIAVQGQGLSYKWFFDNVVIPGATSNQYTINSVNNTHIGAYYCEVTSQCGTIKSNVAQLKINNQPVISEQPKNTAVCEGTTATLNIAASGLENIYEWYLNEVKLNVPSNNFLTIENVDQADAGYYYCLVKNSCGEPQRSENAILTVNAKPSITDQPQNKTVTVGGKAEFTITAANGTLSYKWRKGGNDIPGATTSKYEIAATVKTDAGDYDCIVTNACGTATSIAAKLTINDPVQGPGISFVSESLSLGQFFTDNPHDTTIVNFVTNSGSANLVISNIQITGTNPESFTAAMDNMEIAPGASQALKIKFQPTSGGAKSAIIQFTSNADGSPHSIVISAIGLIWNITMSSTEMNFGDVELNTETTDQFQIVNQSDNKITLFSSDFDCDNQNDFNLKYPILPIELTPHASVDFTVGFKPQTQESYNCDLNIHYLGSNNVSTLKVKGSGKIVSVEDEKAIPSFKAFPNPGGDMLSFEFSLAEVNEYSLEIVNAAGNTVKSFRGNSDGGISRILWDGIDLTGNKLSSGSYMAVLKTGNNSKVLNIILIK